MTSGVVVDVGHGIATCCAVWNGEERPGVISRDPLECTAPVLAKMVHSLVSSFTDQHMKDFFREHIVLTGKTIIIEVYTQHTNSTHSLHYTCTSCFL